MHFRRVGFGEYNLHEYEYGKVVIRVTLLVVVKVEFYRHITEDIKP